MLTQIKKWLGLDTGKEKSEEQRQSDSSTGFTNAEENPNKGRYSEQLVESKQIKGTPFVMVRMPEVAGPNRVFIGIGDQRLTEPMTETEAIKMVMNKEWELIFNTVVYLQRKVNKKIEEEKRSKENFFDEGNIDQWEK